MHKPIATMCPRIDTPCQQLPKFEWGQKRAFCDLCGKHVHNLSAMTRAEQDRLFETQAHPCIRYARLIPAAVLLLASSGPILAQDSAEQVEELDEIVVTGGGPRGPRLEAIFLQSELDTNTALDETSPAEQATRQTNKVESNESH
jgi:hypothetical protein